MEKKKKHADFQDEYRKSSNFEKLSEKDDLKIKGDGKLKIDEDEKMKSEEEKEEIDDALKSVSSEEE